MKIRITHGRENTLYEDMEGLVLEGHPTSDSEVFFVSVNFKDALVFIPCEDLEIVEEGSSTSELGELLKEALDRINLMAPAHFAWAATDTKGELDRHRDLVERLKNAIVECRNQDLKTTGKD